MNDEFLLYGIDPSGIERWIGEAELQIPEDGGDLPLPGDTGVLEPVTIQFWQGSELVNTGSSAVAAHALAQGGLAWLSYRIAIQGDFFPETNADAFVWRIPTGYLPDPAVGGRLAAGAGRFYDADKQYFRHCMVEIRWISGAPFVILMCDNYAAGAGKGYVAKRGVKVNNRPFGGGDVIEWSIVYPLA